MTMTAVHRVIALALTVVVAAYGVLVARDFFRLSDHLVYLAVDDGLANQAVMIATEGRYGFIASPTVLDIPRHHGEVSYGPWYFFTGAGLAWLFGSSLIVIRSVHLWVIVAAAVAARRWFGGLSGAVAAAIFGFSAFYMFDRAMWPMARPDSIVSALAVAFVITAGLAVRDGRARDWFLAGLCASSGAFAHLIAWSFVPVAVVCFAVWAALVAPRQRDGAALRARVLGAAAALALGGVLSALTFYASFGFRFADQLRMFDAYQTLIDSSDGYWATLGGHLEYAFAFMSPAMRIGLAAAIGGCVVGSAALWRHPQLRVVVLTWLFPPLLLWAAYLISNGWYTNQHKGYAILHQVMAAWCVAAGAATFLRAMEWRRPTIWQLVAPLVAVTLLLQGVVQIRAHVDRTTSKRQQAARWVSLAEHSDRVLAPVPAGATAWGSVFFGIESPRRLQLVQFVDVVSLMERIAVERRSAFAPDYLIWGYPETRDLVATVVQRRQPPSIARRVQDVLAGTPYQLTSLVAAPPYGVNRVYARAASIPQGQPLPAVAVYDPGTGRWLNRIGEAIPVPFISAPPLTMRIGDGAGAGERLPIAMMSASLPRGIYLLRVTLAPGAGGGERLLTAVGDRDRTQTIGELGPEGDFTAYSEDDRVVALLSVHDGGVLQVSQFDDGVGAALQKVEVRPIVDGLQPESWVDLPGSWTAAAGVNAVPDASGAWRVQGDASANGYQLLAPVAVPAPQSVEVSLDIAADQGTVCTGALDDRQERWIVPPDQLHDRLSFEIEQASRFWIVVANCAADAPAKVASRFTVRSARISMVPTTLYTDRLMDAAFAR